jgi:cobalt transporter subunit CbtB
LDDYHWKIFREGYPKPLEPPARRPAVWTKGLQDAFLRRFANVISSNTEVGMLSQQVETRAAVSEISQTTRIGAALFALLFGSFMLYSTVFSYSEFLHNAAHDTRHAITAPCH